MNKVRSVAKSVAGPVVAKVVVPKPIVGVVMGSRSDWDTMKGACEILKDFGIPYEAKVVSAHRTPDLLAEYAKSARARGLRCIVAGAGGAAHLPGMLAAFGPVPVLGVPVQSKALSGVDSLHSIVQMPKGIPVATFAIGPAGAVNAALFAAALLAADNRKVRDALDAFRENQTRAVLEDDPLESPEATKTAKRGRGKKA